MSEKVDQVFARMASLSTLDKLRLAAGLLERGKYHMAELIAERAMQELQALRLFPPPVRPVDAQRCEGRYPVPQTSPPRDEPFDVTYRCALLQGHKGPHGAVDVRPGDAQRDT